MSYDEYGGRRTISLPLVIAGLAVVAALGVSLFAVASVREQSMRVDLLRTDVRELEGRLDLEELVLRDAGTLELNDIGRVRLRLASPLPVDPYDRLRRTGAFLVVDPATGNTLAAGLVQDA